MTYKHSGEIAARIENLGQLNDQRLIANNANDLAELERIAHKYELLRHPALTMAHEIRITISLRKQRQHATA